MENEKENESERQDRGGGELKRLGFINTMAIYVLHMYVYAKHNYTGQSLRSSVDAVESAVAAAADPVYRRFKSLPPHLLLHLDHKVDEGINKFDEQAPPSVKWALSRAQLMTQKTYQIAETFTRKAQSGGPSAAIHYSGQIFTQLILLLLANFWYVLNQITALHVAAQMAIPTVSHWSEMYNREIAYLAAKGYTVLSYLPHIPIEEILKAYKQVETERGPVCSLCS